MTDFCFQFQRKRKQIMSNLMHDQNGGTTPIPWNKGKLIGQKPALKLREI